MSTAGSAQLSSNVTPSAIDKVSFVIAGTQRGGTSALHRYLGKHPEICMYQEKEVHFFDDDTQFLAAEPDYAGYRANFSPGSGHRLLGDATPIYMYWEPAAARMKRYNPAMKIIMILRNPVTRAYSHWSHEREGGREPFPFLKALQAEPERARNSAPRQLKRWSYIDRGFYTQQLSRMWRHFPRGQTLILRSEELRDAHERLLAKVADFLGIGRFPEITAKTVNACAYSAAMTAEEKSYLVRTFEKEVRELERLLGWDCAGWLR